MPGSNIKNAPKLLVKANTAITDT